MTPHPDHGDDLATLYRARFEGADADRVRVWRILVDRVFQAYVPPEGSVLDVGCGWGEFINAIGAKRRYAIDLNPDARARLAPGVEFFRQSCADPWPLPDGSLDAVFTSNFLEHLPSKDLVVATVEQGVRCLKPGGRMICMGPNVRLVPGAYWDFFDHQVPLSDQSVCELLHLIGFDLLRVEARFLPYTTRSRVPQAPWIVGAYLALRPLSSALIGKQFLVVAAKPAGM